MAIRYASGLDRTFHALGDETRRKMLATISQRGRCSAGELVELFESSQPTISKHLRVMENAALLVRQIEGRQHFFTINSKPLEDADAWLRRHLLFWESSLSRLGNFLDQKQDKTGKKKPDMSMNQDPLILRQHFQYEPAYVFAAFKSADAIVQWFAPHDSINTRVTDFEFREGGRYRMEFALEDGVKTCLAGVFQTICEPEHLVFSFCWEAPDPHAGIDTVVTVDFVSHEQTTELIVSHLQLKGEAMKNRHAEGWQGTLHRLGVYLKRLRTGQ